MLLSMNWLKDYVNINVDPKEFSETMTMSGSKVEEYTIEAEILKNIVVGKIISKEQHPDADKLVVCQVDIGKDEPIQIVTGANNMIVSDLVPIALHKSTISNGTKITKGKLRGILSDGMMCSLSELGLTKSDFPYTIEDGIMVIKEECSPGDNIIDALNLTDISVEFELTSNRSDCNSVLGLAREVQATYNKKPLNIKTPVVKGSGGDIKEYLSVEVKNPELCNRYTAKVVKNVKIASSPRWLRERLRNSGVRSINNLVDITNYVMLEYGQPMHAFDYSHIGDKKIIVRTATNDEDVTTLDGKKMNLDDKVLVIADSNKPVGLAGVMGGENSGIENNTTTVVFESAHFNAANIRETAKKLGIASESAARYAKNTDEEVCIQALLRACELVELLDAGEIVDGMINVDNYNFTPTQIILDTKWINEFVNINLSKKEMIIILENVGFKIENDLVFVPSYRKDVTHKADLAEEIARFYGYNNIPTTVLRGTANGRFTESQLFEEKIKQILVGCGGNEILTMSFLNPKDYDKMMVPKYSIEREAVEIINPLGAETSFLRNNIIPSMLNVLSTNYNNRNYEFSGFEIAKEFIKNENDLPDEIKQIIIGMYNYDNTLCDFFHIKGYVTKLMDNLKIKNYEITQDTTNTSFHPGRCGKITIGSEVVGYLGEIHPLIISNFDIKAKTYIAKIDYEKLFKYSPKNIKFEEYSRFPATGRDLAFVADKNIPVLDIRKILTKHFSSILESIELFDVYEGANIDDGKRSLAFQIVLRSKEGTLTDIIVNEKVDSALLELNSLGVVLRS